MKKIIFLILGCVACTFLCCNKDKTDSSVDSYESLYGTWQLAKYKHAENEEYRDWQYELYDTAYISFYVDKTYNLKGKYMMGWDNKTGTFTIDDNVIYEKNNYIIYTDKGSIQQEILRRFTIISLQDTSLEVKYEYNIKTLDIDSGITLVNIFLLLDKKSETL